MRIEKRAVGKRSLSASVLAIVAGMLVVSSATLASVPPAVVQSAGTLAPPHTDYGLDTDGDSLYDYLVVDVNVDVTLAGMFYLDCMLSDPIGGSVITFAFNMTNLNTGVQVVPVWFSGISIRATGINGSYQVDIALYNDTFVMVDFGVHMTFGYVYTDFQKPPAEFAPPHIDYGVDTDGDTFFNWLVVEAALNVTTAGPYQVMAGLYDNSGMSLITFASWGGLLGTGIQVVQLQFRGYPIYLSGFDGRYMVDLRVYDSMGMFLDNDTYMTQGYSFTDFEPTPGAVFSPPYSDFGLDTDGDTLFNYLVVVVTIDVSEPGLYYVDATLFDSSGTIFITSSTNTSNLVMGMNSVWLEFTGYEIRNSGIDGSYMVSLTLRDDFMMLGTDVYTTGAYLATWFETPPAQFGFPHNSYGLDTDGDTFFNYLVVEVAVIVNDPGTYTVSGSLWDSTGMVWLGYAQNQTYLNAGPQSVELRYPGYQIRSAGIDGPYMVDLTLYQDMIWLGSDMYLTTGYSFTEFETPPIGFGFPHSDYGLDTDGDSLYDYLMVDATVIVNDSGTYDFSAVLTDSSGMTFIDSDSNITDLTAGVRIVQFRFDGFTIRQSGIDGSYMVSMSVYEGGNLVDTDVHFTAIYSSTEFELPPGEFTPPHPYYGIDTDLPLDGSYNFLAVDAKVNISDAGEFLVQGVLFDMTMTLQVTAVNLTYLDVGAQTVQLRFSGVSIFLSGINGPYVVYLILGTFEQGTMNTIDTDWFLTGPHTYTQFQPANPAMIYGYVFEAATGNPVGATIQVFNFTEGYINMTATDPMGYYEMNAFEGEFCVIADTTTLQAEAVMVSVSGSTNVTINLTATPPDDMSTDVTFTGWDNVNITARMSLEGDNQTIRLMIDYLFGNRDAYIDRSEIEHFIGAMGQPPTMFQNTTDQFYVDGIHYDLVAGSFGFWGGGEGGVSDDVPIILNLAGDYVSNSSIPVALTHLIEVNVTYDNATMEGVLYASIPASYFLQSYDPVANVNVGGVGTANIVVDPLLSPSPSTTYVWVNLTLQQVLDSEAPEIANVLINGLPSVTYYISNPPANAMLTALVDDAATGGLRIGGANYTTPTATSWPGIFMGATDGAFDELTEDVFASISVPTSVGTHRFYVYGWDIVPNINNTAPYATITVVDDLSPSITNVQIDGQTSVTYYLSSLPTTINLMAVVDDSLRGNSLIIGANYTTPTGTSWPGVAMSAVDGTFDEVMENVEASIVPPTTAGTYDYYVHAWDSGTNTYGSAPYATVTIVDDLAPEITNVQIDGQTSVTYYLSNLPATMSLVAVVDDTLTGGSIIAGANYTTPTATSWPGILMTAVDGAFDEPMENVMASVSPPTLAGTYSYYVHARDSASNKNDTAPYATVTIVDDLPPSISQVQANGQASVTVRPGTSVTLSAQVSDTASGSSDIAGANYTLGAGQWPGTAMTASDGAFDSSQEGVIVTIPTTGWTEGTHEVCVYAWDADQGYNTTAQACADIVIDATPPSITNVATEPSSPVEGDDVTISASVTDTGGVAGVSVEVRDDGGALIGNFTMTYDAVDLRYEYTRTYDDAGDYTFKIWAVDDSGNAASASGDFTVEQVVTPSPQKSFLEEFWWVLVLVAVIIVVGIVAMLFMRKKRAVPEAPPPQQLPAAPPALPQQPPTAPPPAPPQVGPPPPPEQPPQPPQQQTSGPGGM